MNEMRVKLMAALDMKIEASEMQSAIANIASD